ncbi:MAG TPA: hypothetical protein VNO84_02430 [Burkholderiaceae bacterium]|nr:hypothetical protein [Burkholderiaceae bacterium]
MGFFDMFRPKTPADSLQDEMKRLAPILFPGGHEQIQSAGRSIAALLDNRIPPESAAKIFASTKYLAHTTKDKSKERVVGYIVRQGMGRITEDEAGFIYDRFIDSSPPKQHVPPAAVAPAETDAMYIDDSLAGKTYQLRNSFRTVEVSAIIFTVMLLGLKGQGWRGAPHLFTPDGSAMNPLRGAYEISGRDARELSLALQRAVANSDLDPDTKEMVSPLISIASQGAFTVYA